MFVLELCFARRFLLPLRCLLPAASAAHAACVMCGCVLVVTRGRACCLLKEAVCNDVEHWCEKRRQAQTKRTMPIALFDEWCVLCQVQDGGKEEDGGAGLRMLLQQAEEEAQREFE